MSTVAERFAQWALDLRLQDVPKDVVEAAKRHLLDGSGCATAAARTGDAEPAVDTALALGGPAEATIIGRDDRVSAPAAALANGALVHALDFDDTHARALVHATAAVLPATFAVGEQEGVSGEEALVAAIAGYEVVARLGAAVTHGFHAAGFHATSVCGVFASALVASRLMGGSAYSTANALGIAGSMAAGSLEFLATGSSTKQLHPGLAAMNGIIAARLANDGADGPASIFEGERGFFHSYTRQAVDPETLTGTLGRDWETSNITIKPYPACQLVHASLDAVKTVLPLDPAAIESVAVAVPKEVVEIVCEPAMSKLRPRSAYEAKFSLQFCIATMIVDGSVGVDSFEQDLSRAEVLDLARKVEWTEAPFDGPPADAPGDITVRLKDGRSARATVERSSGGPANPLTDDEIFAKFASNHGGHGARALAKAFLSLEQAPSLATVLRAGDEVAR